MKIARDIGLDIAKLERDMKSEPVDQHISSSHQLAEHMGLVGTPTFVAGDEGAFGEYSLAEMRELVQRARQTLA